MSFFLCFSLWLSGIASGRQWQSAKLGQLNWLVPPRDEMSFVMQMWCVSVLLCDDSLRLPMIAPHTTLQAPHFFIGQPSAPAHSHLSHSQIDFRPLSSGRGLDFSFFSLSLHLIHWKAIRSMALSHPIALLLQLCLCVSLSDVTVCDLIPFRLGQQFAIFLILILAAALPLCTLRSTLSIDASSLSLSLSHRLAILIDSP